MTTAPTSATSYAGRRPAIAASQHGTEP